MLEKDTIISVFIFREDTVSKRNIADTVGREIICMFLWRFLMETFRVLQYVRVGRKAILRR